MAQVNPDRKKVLLLEPNYSNKFPPIGLMKLATYHKQLGYEVIFYKGDLTLFVIERVADKCIDALILLDNSIDWTLRKDILIDFIRYRKKEFLQQLNLSDSEVELLLTAKVEEYRDYYHKGFWEKEPEFDRVFVTTLFTFYWKTTIDTIRFAKKFIKRRGMFMVGGVLATLQAEEVATAAGIDLKKNIHRGVLNTPGQFDKGDDKIIDNLPLDYSILDEIDYKYPMNNAFYGYTTRGCVRHCDFCAVPILEPKYNAYIPLQERVELVRHTYGDQKDLLLMDNNILASRRLADIIQEIINSGFGKKDKFLQPDLLEISINNLRNGINDRAYIRKAQGLIMDFYGKLKNGSDEAVQVYDVVFKKYHLNKLLTTKKENLLSAYEEIKEIYKRHFRPTPRMRCVDFNQGVDARLFTEEKVQLLSQINVRPLRVAFDDIKTLSEYEKAIRMSAAAGMRDFSNYLLYNFHDKPIDLYNRLKINVDLCEDLQVSIYSFPMKYHPILKTGNEIDYSHNRDYIGEHWNRKYIRAVQAVLNSTKGKIGRGRSFFYKAFGKDEQAFNELLEMPETFIIYRYFFEWLGKPENNFVASTKNWQDCFYSLNNTQMEEALSIIHANKFIDAGKLTTSRKVKKLLNFYINFRDDIITPGTELYKKKQEWDVSPDNPKNNKRIILV
jgi:hypothetical protein